MCAPPADVAGKVLHQTLYAMYSSDRAVQQRVATALARLAATADLKTVREYSCA